MQKANLTADEFANELTKYRKVLVVSHYNPDPDAFGSSCGLALGLRELGFTAALLNQDGPVERLGFIPGAKEISSNIPTEEFDALLACDCGDEKRLGDTLRPVLLPRFTRVLNLDHHQSNNFFGTHNRVVAEASSTSELVFELLNILGKRVGKNAITKDVANALYAGISADTGSFRYSSTGPSTFRAAGELLTLGAEPGKISQELYSNSSKSAVLVQAEALSNLRFEFGGKVSVVTVSKSLLVKHNAQADDTEDLVERARDIAGVEISVFLREDDDFWKASLRSKSEKYDVAAVAQKFGGGGHRAAAGLRFRGTGAELEKRILAELKLLVT